MGYARYKTPLGDAGYDVEDTCHDAGCEEKIDRGLYYLCGGTPGSPDEFGCGRWFCGHHLYGPAEGAGCSGQCKPCMDEWLAVRAEDDQVPLLDEVRREAAPGQAAQAPR